jgi:hypothetical protein
VGGWCFMHVCFLKGLCKLCACMEPDGPQLGQEVCGYAASTLL